MESIGTIGWAVTELKNGRKVCRRGWNGKGMWLWMAMTRQTADGPVVGQHVCIHPPSGPDMPWLCSAIDLLAPDWEHAE